MSKYFYWFLMIPAGILTVINLHNNEELKAIFEAIIYMGCLICLEIKGRK